MTILVILVYARLKISTFGMYRDDLNVKKSLGYIGEGEQFMGQQIPK